MKNILAILLMFTCPNLLSAQFTIPGHTGAIAASGGGPTFTQYTYVAPNGSTLASITSPSKTISTGDLLFVFCAAMTISASTAITAIAASSSPANTFNALTLLNGGAAGTGVQLSWSIASSSGATTFTCTPTASIPNMAMVVLDISSGATTYNTSINYGYNYASAWTTGSFTTSQRTVNVFCLGIGSQYGGSTVTAGLIGGYASTIVGVSGPTLTASTNEACELYISTGAMTSQTAAMAPNSSNYGVGTFAAIKY